MEKALKHLRIFFLTGLTTVMWYIVTNKAERKYYKDQTRLDALNDILTNKRAK